MQFHLILVIDDDPVVTRTLSLNLQADGYDVVSASSGGEALQHLAHRLPDLAIVDLMLPDIHGFELSQKIKAYNDIPIVMLTAVGTEESIVAGLEQFAEDYVVKPFSYKQLEARIARVLKRTQLAKPETDVVKIGEGVETDWAHHVVTTEGIVKKLTPAESRALASLLSQKNQIVTTEQLMEQVWEDGEGDEDRVWVLINRLRQKIEPDPKAPRYLVNERGVGYKLEVGRG